MVSVVCTCYKALSFQWRINDTHDGMVGNIIGIVFFFELIR